MGSSRALSSPSPCGWVARVRYQLRPQGSTNNEECPLARRIQFSQSKIPRQDSQQEVSCAHGNRYRCASKCRRSRRSGSGSSTTQPQPRSASYMTRRTVNGREPVLTNLEEHLESNDMRSTIASVREPYKSTSEFVAGQKTSWQWKAETVWAQLMVVEKERKDLSHQVQQKLLDLQREEVMAGNKNEEDMAADGEDEQQWRQRALESQVQLVEHRASVEELKRQLRLVQKYRSSFERSDNNSSGAELQYPKKEGSLEKTEADHSQACKATLSMIKRSQDAEANSSLCIAHLDKELQDIISKRLTEIIPQDHSGMEDKMSMTREYLETGCTVQRELTLNVPVGGITGVCMGAMDVTEQVKTQAILSRLQAEMAAQENAEKELQKSLQMSVEAIQAKTNFVTVLSHEIRTPLNGVLGLAETLAHTHLDSEQGELVEKMLESGAELVKLVNNMLNFSKAEAGGLVLENTVYQPASLATQLLKTFRTSADTRNVELRCEFDPSVPDKVVGDSRRLEEILSIIIDNAIKFTEENTSGLVTLRMSASTRCPFSRPSEQHSLSFGGTTSAGAHEAPYTEFHSSGSTLMDTPTVTSRPAMAPGEGAVSEDGRWADMPFSSKEGSEEPSPSAANVLKNSSHGQHSKGTAGKAMSSTAVGTLGIGSHERQAEGGAWSGRSDRVGLVPGWQSWEVGKVRQAGDEAKMEMGAGVGAVAVAETRLAEVEDCNGEGHSGQNLLGDEQKGQGGAGNLQRDAEGRVNRSRQDELWLHFEVVDTGIGIPAWAFHTLFDKFTQVNGGTKRPSGGTGLGLAIAKQLVELLGGKITVQSQQNKGSAFSFNIPCWSASDLPSPPPSQLYEAAQPQDFQPTSGLAPSRVTDCQPRSTGTVGASDRAGSGASSSCMEVGNKSTADLGGETANAPHPGREKYTRREPPVDGLHQNGSGSFGWGVDSNVSECRKRMFGSTSGHQLDEALKGSRPDSGASEDRQRGEVEDGSESPTVRRKLAREAVMAAEERKDQKSSRILVVDDNRMNQLVAVSMLKKMGQAADVARDGAEAVLSLQAKEYDLVLMDVCMPVMDGLEATRLIREYEERGVWLVGDSNAAPSVNQEEGLGLELRTRYSEYCMEEGTTWECPRGLGVGEDTFCSDGSQMASRQLEERGEEEWRMRRGGGPQEKGEMGKVRRRLICGRWRRSRVPIVALTANAFAEDVQRCLDSGMDSFISKPVTFEKLKSALDCFMLNEVLV